MTSELCQLILCSFAKWTMRVSTLGTIEAETTVTEKGELRLVDSLSCKNAG